MKIEECLFNTTQPLYKHIKNMLMSAIFSGICEPNELLPSTRQFALTLNVSTITAKRAYADLKNEGLIYTVAGKGTFVVGDLASIKNAIQESLLIDFKANIMILKSMGFDINKLHDIVDRVFDNYLN